MVPDVSNVLDLSGVLFGVTLVPLPWESPHWSIRYARTNACGIAGIRLCTSGLWGWMGGRILVCTATTNNSSFPSPISTPFLLCSVPPHSAIFPIPCSNLLALEDHPSLLMHGWCMESCQWLVAFWYSHAIFTYYNLWKNPCPTEVCVLCRKWVVCIVTGVPHPQTYLPASSNCVEKGRFIQTFPSHIF